MATVNSSTPKFMSLGVKDESIVNVPVEAETPPQCVSLIYLYAQKGTTSRFFGNDAQAKECFGSETFSDSSKYFMHTTDLRNDLVAAGGYCVLQRVIPEDAGVRANVSVYMDVLETMVPNYKRNSTGMFFLAGGSTKELDDTTPYIPGFQIKWYKTAEKTKDADKLGGLVSKEGSMKKWKMATDDTEVHVTEADSNNISGQASGHNNWADKTVYTYASAEDMWQPTNETKRHKYTVDGGGNRTDEGECDFDVDNTTASQMYPIFEARASYHGEWYNLLGFSIESLFGSYVNKKIVSETKNLPYSFHMQAKADAFSSPKYVTNLDGDTGTVITFQKNAINPSTGGNISFEECVDNGYYNETNANRKMKAREIEKIFFYRDNFESVLKRVVEKEKEYISRVAGLDPWEDGLTSDTFSWFDFTTDDKVEILKEYGLINPFTCSSTQKIPFFTIGYNLNKPHATVADFTEINLTSNTGIFLMNGSDGTMSREAFEKLVVEDIKKYRDPDSLYMGLARNVESFLWDSGFEKETKEELSAFISVRKGTVYVSCTHYDSLDDQSLSLTDQKALGASLVSSIRLNADSEEYNTGTIRSAVIMGTGRKEGSTKRHSLIKDIAVKTVKLMGGTDRRWKTEYIFDDGEHNVITDYIDISPVDIPESTKTVLHEAGLTYPEPYDRRLYYFPVVKTVYDNETSVASNYLNMLVLPFCERVAFEVHRELTGNTRLSPAAFLKKATDKANQKLSGAFGGYIQSIAEATMEEIDKAKGYVWRLTIKNYCNVNRTVQIYHTEFYRTSALETK